MFISSEGIYFPRRLPFIYYCYFLIFLATIINLYSIKLLFIYTSCFTLLCHITAMCLKHNWFFSFYIKYDMEFLYFCHFTYFKRFLTIICWQWFLNRNNYNIYMLYAKMKLVIYHSSFQLSWYKLIRL